MCKCLTSFHADTLKSLDEDKRVNPRARQLEKILAKKLSEYLSCEVCYAIRRVMAAEQNRLYRGPDRGKLLSLNHSRKAPCIIFIFHALLNLGSVIDKAKKYMYTSQYSNNYNLRDIYASSYITVSCTKCVPLLYFSFQYSVLITTIYDSEVHLNSFRICKHINDK